MSFSHAGHTAENGHGLRSSEANTRSRCDRGLWAGAGGRVRSPVISWTFGKTK
jgi:hypothetical protein